MDKRERMVFNELRPYLLINEEEWIHLDLDNTNIPIVYNTYYFPTNEWISIRIFNSIEHLENYLSINEASNLSLNQYVNSCVRSERIKIAKNKMELDTNHPPKLIVDEEGIRIHPYYLKNLSE